jgi:hypothetical protein
MKGIDVEGRFYSESPSPKASEDHRNNRNATRHQFTGGRPRKTETAIASASPPSCCIACAEHREMARPLARQRPTAIKPSSHQIAVARDHQAS